MSRSSLALAAFVALSVASAAWRAAAQPADSPPPPPYPTPSSGALAPAAQDRSLAALIAGPQRSAANKARDPWRHPFDTLEFWGVQPGLTVVEIDPGGGYWTEIIAPFLGDGGGHYIAAMADPNDPASPDAVRKALAAFDARFADHAAYGPIADATFAGDGTLAVAPGSVDLIIISRNIHNLMWTPGALDNAMASFYAALRPGGVLAVEEHRADPRAMVQDARDGYVSEAFVIAAAAKAGFELDARSDINANPKDSKDHPFGVWTLPPTRRSSPIGQPPDPNFDHAKYDAIGESDRMTLRLTKPG
jgi:predicted methyltransferase